MKPLDSVAAAPTLAGPPAVVTSWKTLLLGALATGIVALSIHAVMLQGLDVPYPGDLPKTGWLAFLAFTPVVLGTVWLTALAWPRLQPFRPVTRYFLLVGLVAMMTESLFRGFLMDGWVTTAWRYSFVADSPALLAVVFYVGGAVLTVVCCRGWRARVVAGVGVAALLTFVVKPAIHSSLAALLQRLKYLNHEARYGFPYGWQVIVPAYLTFVEPIAAGLGIAWLIWPQLPASPRQRLLVFVALLMLLRGQAVKPFLNIFYDHHGYLLGFLAQFQFTLESLALATGLGWVWSAAVVYVQPKARQQLLMSPAGDIGRVPLALRDGE